MSSVTTRLATHGDLPTILALLRQPDMDGAATLSVTEARAVLDRIAATSGRRVYVSEVAGAVVGTFALIVVQHLAHRGACSAVVGDVVVSTEHQGRGVGREMMRHAAALAQESGCYKPALSSGTGRAAAHRFYERLGFERHGVSFLLPLGSDGGA